MSWLIACLKTLMYMKISISMNFLQLQMELHSLISDFSNGKTKNMCLTDLSND